MSSNANEQPTDFESVKNRLAEIADAVDDENLSLDDALDLYEEAVALGLQASDLLEAGIVAPEEDEPEGQSGINSEGAATTAPEADEPTGLASDQA